MKRRILTKSRPLKGRNQAKTYGQQRSECQAPVKVGWLMIRPVLLAIHLTFLLSLYLGTVPNSVGAILYITENKTISDAETIDSGDTVRVLPGVTLTVADSGTLRVLGAIQNLGTIENHGTVTIQNSGTLDNGAVVLNAGNISNSSIVVGLNNLVGGVIDNASESVISNYGTIVNCHGAIIRNVERGNIINDEGSFMENGGKIIHYSGILVNTERDTASKQSELVGIPSYSK